jgi:hypothetical protein
MTCFFFFSASRSKHIKATGAFPAFPERSAAVLLNIAIS